MSEEIQRYNQQLSPEDQLIANALATAISEVLVEAESKVWHAHPVWFIEGNPIVGYSKLKNSMRLLFWSGRSFVTPGLTNEGKFQAAELRLTSVEALDTELLKKWLLESRDVQWDYKNIVKRKGELIRLK
ncbi:MAG: hypothetical protein RL226_1836 [Bacteroidota bacterium]|jgi:hypothetical protein